MSDQPMTEEAEVELTTREALLPPKLRDWRAKLSAKAKQEKRYRFYSLYGLVSHPETLKAAWAQVRANDGSPGVDGETIARIVAARERNLDPHSPCQAGTHPTVNAPRKNVLRKPDAGNLHVRFDEGEGSQRSLT